MLISMLMIHKYIKYFLRILPQMIVDTNDLREHLNPISQKQQGKQSDQQGISEETIKFLKKLEGDCRINRHIILKINYLKAVFLTLPCALTFIGFILLYQFKAFRCFMLFDKLQPSQKHKATHIWAQSSNRIDGICRLRKKTWKGSQVYVFCFEELLYQLHHEAVLPLGIKVKEEIGSFLTSEYLSQGLSEEQASLRLQFYGRNEHLVKIPTYYQFLFNIFFLQLFSYIQYFTSFVYVLEDLLFYSVFLIGANFVTSSINYIFIRISYIKIKEIAEKKHYVKVLRSGAWRTIENSQLVPGDLYQPSELIACDSVVVRQDLFVSEVGFTGESIPIGKFALADPQRVFESEHWAYEGSEIVSKKENCIAVAVNTGYSTRKGRIIRKILNPKPDDNDMFKNLLQNSLVMIIVMISAYLAFYNHMFDGVEDRNLAYIIFLSLVIQSLPASIPVFFNAAYTLMLIRLKLQNVVGLKREKTIESSRLETICFDKTGTLTENEMEIKGILIPHPETHVLQNVSPEALTQHYVLRRLFACCHAVQIEEEKVHGDEIDVQMYKAAKVLLRNKGLAEGIVFEVDGTEAQDAISLEVLRIHQFESKFQSMSVVARDKKKHETFVFVKGAPEKLHAASTVQLPRFVETVRELSLEGYRSIAVSGKRVTAEQAMLFDREQCLEGTSLLAIVTFANALKPDSVQTIAALKAAEIKTKIVTGDSIFVAIQTALSLQMVPRDCRIIALEGSRLRADGGLTAVAVHREGSKIVEEEMDIPALTPRFFDGQILAMDFEFIKQRQQFFLQSNATVFARATPETKAVILKKQKEKVKANYEQRTRWSRLFGGRIRKVGMVGDGANDLMAIREADVGIGISNSDAVYSADFTITTLSQVTLIIRQGRAGETKMMETVAFIQQCSYIMNVISVLTTSDMSVMAFIPTVLKNFGLLYFVSVLISYTPPTDELTPYCPSFNLVGLEFMLIWWGSAVIIAGGMGVSMIYYKQSADFVPNPDRSSLNGYNKSATICFLSMFLISWFVGIAFVGARPFKKTLFQNRPLMIVLIIDIILITAAFFYSEHLHFFQLEPIALEQAITVYLICLCTGCLNVAYACCIRAAELYKEQFPKVQNEYARIKELTHSI